MNKDESIVKLLALLDLPAHDWVVSDHWDGDMFAVGVASGSRPGRLVYVSTFDQPAGVYTYELELPPRNRTEVYCPAGGRAGVTLQQLLAVMIEHLDG